MSTHYTDARILKSQFAIGLSIAFILLYEPEWRVGGNTLYLGFAINRVTVVSVEMSLYMPN